MIQYRADLNGVCWNRISDLMKAVGWDERRPEELQQAFTKSTYVRITYDENNIIGFGRTVDDGKYYGMIVDLVVDPEYQNRGIGSKMLRELRDAMSGYKIISLRAAPGMKGFYLKQGWKNSKSAFSPDRRSP